MWLLRVLFEICNDISAILATINASNYSWCILMNINLCIQIQATFLMRSKPFVCLVNEDMY